jgi:predicted dehydrogenase
MANMEGDPFQTQLFGTKAGAIVKAWGEKPVEIFTEQNKQMFTMVPSNVPDIESSHVKEVQSFVKAVLAGDPSPVPGENGMTLNAIFDALYKSSETGKEVKVDTTF